MPLQQLANWLAASNSTVAFTGAGISTESGIPDFRSPGGVWSQSQPVYFDEFLASAEARYEYWRQKSIAHRDFAQAQPNTGHQVLADWESREVICALITQNIDGLHQEAGSQRVFELHGTARWIACLDCGHRVKADPLVAEFLETDKVPSCPICGGRMKHATISFGQQLPHDVLDTSFELAASSEVFLAIGSSLVVEPAASLPRLAAQAGSRLVIINRDETPLDGLATLVVREAIGATLAAVDALLSGKPPGSDATA